MPNTNTPPVRARLSVPADRVAAGSFVALSVFGEVVSVHDDLASAKRAVSRMAAADMRSIRIRGS